MLEAEFQPQRVNKVKRTTVAYVDSSNDRCKKYIVIQRGDALECNCLDFFFKENRSDHCKHIKKVLNTRFDGGKAEHFKSVVLTSKGKRILLHRDKRARQNVDVSAALRMASSHPPSTGPDPVR